MGSPTIEQILQALNVRDFGAVGDGNEDDAHEIQDAINQAAIVARHKGNGAVFVPWGHYRCSTPLVLPSNVEVLGFGHASRLFTSPDANNDVLQVVNATNWRIRDILLDGNRANNTSGNGLGLSVLGCVDGWLDNVEVTGARADGIQIGESERIHANAPQTYDNGRHGIALNHSAFCTLMVPRAYNNSRVVAGNAGDGINLDLVSTDNVIIAPECYETARVAGQQGYGVRETLGGNCARNLVIGGLFSGNVTGDTLMEPDSLHLSYNMLMTGGLALGMAGSAPNAAALLDVVSTRQGVGLPRMTTAQRNGIVSPFAGLVIYNTTSNKLNVYTGSAWEAVTSA